MRETYGFNSRPSCDGRHVRDGFENVFAVVSIHARLATGDRTIITGLPYSVGVSIHARLATGDLIRKSVFGRFYVSIHARLATGDYSSVLQDIKIEAFQFTPVLRRATDKDILHLLLY